ncbi:hypothetical protein PsorP6_014948 [Peronosclerospora sorghi]|uniref:Uncharacterized protein n=1 Tax=Peronosclerospora sorghi TaxID=230839 RepID=A0ACC0VR14_9STRA|nr:hypothetical protein PsorP6_014948 [Peronosclerospora sorghi]
MRSSTYDNDVEMNEPMEVEEEHEPVTAVVPSGVPTTTATQHTPKPPVMSDAMVFRPGPNHRVSDQLHVPLQVTKSKERPRELTSTHQKPSGQLRLDYRPYNPGDNSIVPYDDSGVSGSERDRSAKRPRVDDDDVLYEVALAAQDTPRTYKEAVTCDVK